MQPGHLLIQVLGQDVDPVLVGLPAGEQLSWAMTWLEKELDITKLGWPVALPRLSRRPSERTITACPSGEDPLVHLGA